MNWKNMPAGWSSGLVKFSLIFFPLRPPGCTTPIWRLFPEHVQNHPSDEEPEKAYAQLTIGLARQSDFMKYFLERWQPDSAIVFRMKVLESEKSLLKEADWLEHFVSVFCIVNKLNKPDDKSRIPDFLREEWKRLEYILSIQKILFPVIEAEKNCLNGFQPDSIASAEKRRLAFSGLVALQTQTMKSLAAVKGDKFIKPAALQSLYLFAIEAKNELQHLEKFLKAEEDFILLHRKQKSETANSTAEKEAYRKAVRKYNEDIRGANELVQKLEENQKQHLNAFFDAQRNFLEEGLKAFRE